MKRVLMILGVVSLLSLAALAQGNTVTICHVPPGNQTAGQTITISQSALNTHLAHGDFPVSCEALGPSDRSFVVFGLMFVGWAGLMLYRRNYQTSRQ